MGDYVVGSNINAIVAQTKNNNNHIGFVTIVLQLNDNFCNTLYKNIKNSTKQENQYLVRNKHIT